MNFPLRSISSAPGGTRRFSADPSPSTRPSRTTKTAFSTRLPPPSNTDAPTKAFKPGTGSGGGALLHPAITNPIRLNKSVPRTTVLSVVIVTLPPEGNTSTWGAVLQRGPAEGMRGKQRDIK